MRLNIFRIPARLAGPLRKNLTKNELSVTRQFEQGDWTGEFYFSKDPEPGRVSWTDTFRDYIGDGHYFNRSYYGVMTMARGESYYAISFGKAHFYVRPYCDYDFGVEVAKRIVDENEITQTSARRYQGKQRKDIRSFGPQARLSVPPGNSVDYLQGQILPEKTEHFGDTAKFGTSCLLAPEITPDEIGTFLARLEIELAAPARFQLPRTLVLSDDAEIARYDEKLIDELFSEVGISDIATNTFDLYGVDFVFSSTGSFTIRCGHYAARDLDRLTMKEVKEYIKEKAIPRHQVLRLKITHRREGEPVFSEPIKQLVDFICDEDHVVLSGGKWLKFNEDYLKALDTSIRRIQVEETEADLVEIALDEGPFNAGLAGYGYTVADKNFAILQTAGTAPTEAWDLQKGDTVYAVKFGTPQKLNYVVDQAMSVLEILRNGANTNAVPPFAKYCLWLGYRAKRRPASLADSGSIILKQKVEEWSRRCGDVGITPVLKLSRKYDERYDTPDGSPRQPTH